MKICVLLCSGRKYLKGKAFFCVNPRGGSQFWRGCMKKNKYVRKGLNLQWGMDRGLGSGLMFGWMIVL
jgi:hypothetical protein